MQGASVYYYARAQQAWCTGDIRFKVLVALSTAGIGLIEGCNRRKCALVISSVKLRAHLVRFLKCVIGSSLAEIVKIANTRMSN